LSSKKEKKKKKKKKKKIAQQKPPPPKKLTLQPKHATDEHLTNMTKPPIHPYADANDGAYGAPQQQNFTGLLKPVLPKKLEPAYHTTAPIYMMGK
jgi:hypothetical protein